MPDAIKPTLGDSIRVYAVLRRRQSHQRRYWLAMPIEPRRGLYIGYRTLIDGRVEYDEHGVAEFYPESHGRAALVVFSERERPVLVRFDDLRTEVANA